MNFVMHHSFRRAAWAASFASSLLLFAPSVFADDSTDLPKEAQTRYPNERPSWGKQPEDAPNAVWYGRQIIAPTAGFDVLSVVGVPLLFGGSPSLGAGFIISGMAGRGLSGPIVHLGHGRPLHALASLGLESSGILVGIGVASFVGRACPRLAGADVGPSCNMGAFITLQMALPLAVSITGTMIDAMVLAHDKPAPDTKTARLPFSITPYALPLVQRDARASTQKISMQLGLAGQF